MEREERARRVAWVGAVALLVAIAPVARGATNDVPALALEWTAPAECPSRARVVDDVATLLGTKSDAPDRLVARARVERRGAGWHVTIVMMRANRFTTRELDAESCGAAADATALILALTIDPSRALGEPVAAEPPSTTSDASADAAPPEPADAGAAEDASARDAEPAPIEPPPLAARLPPFAAIETIASDVGTLPHFGLGLGGGLAWLPRPFAFEVTLAYWASQRAQLGSDASRGGSFGMLSGEAGACVEPSIGRLALGPCAGAGVSWVQAEGYGVRVPLTSSAAWASLLAGGQLTLRLSELWSLRADGRASVPFARPSFDLEGIGVVHRPAALAMRLYAGAEVRF